MQTYSHAALKKPVFQNHYFILFVVVWTQAFYGARVPVCVF